MVVFIVLVVFLAVLRLTGFPAQRRSRSLRWSLRVSESPLARRRELDKPGDALNRTKMDLGQDVCQTTQR